jgi:hypothetical protein
MADSDNRAFHLAATGLAVVAGLLGLWVTSPHPQAWLFGLVAAVAVLVPAELVFFSRERPRSPVKEPRAVQQVASDDDFSLLGRALTATRKLDPDKEKKLSEALSRAMELIEERKEEGLPAVEELRVKVRQTTEELESHVQDENLDRVMLGARLRILREELEEAIPKAEPG